MRTNDTGSATSETDVEGAGFANSRGALLPGRCRGARLRAFVGRLREGLTSAAASWAFKLQRMPFMNLPPFAAWRHRDARDGFEVVFMGSDEDGYLLDGHTTAVENGDAWAVAYAIRLTPSWLTQSARVVGHSVSGRRELALDSDERGGWRINGVPAPHLDGCLDIDLESSSLTNAFPVHRLGLRVGRGAEAPAAYVRALEFGVERLEQRYVRTKDDGGHERYDYAAPRFEFEAKLIYDEFGLVVEYPGLAVRAA